MNCRLCQWIHHVHASSTGMHGPEYIHKMKFYEQDLITLMYQKKKKHYWTGTCISLHVHNRFSRVQHIKLVQRRSKSYRMATFPFVISNHLPSELTMKRPLSHDPPWLIHGQMSTDIIKAQRSTTSLQVSPNVSPLFITLYYNLGIWGELLHMKMIQLNNDMEIFGQHFG